MEHRPNHPVHYRVTGRRNNVTVVVRELSTREEAETLARRIVLATRLLGSVADHTVRHSHVPVIVVPEPD